MLGVMNKECRSCKYFESWLGVCGYAEQVGKTRIAIHGGDYRELLDGPCQERKPRKRKKSDGHAWREKPIIPNKMRRKKR